MRQGATEKDSGKSGATRAKIIASATALFHSKGFEATTMRDIAERASLSVGSAYYYFSTKDELVLAFYEETQLEAEDKALAILKETRSFDKRIKRYFRARFSTMEEHRDLLIVLGRHGADPNSPLSPFGEQSHNLRERAVAIFKKLYDGSDFKASRELEKVVPTLFWIYQMGVVFFWLHDNSQGRKRTNEFVDKSVTLIINSMTLASLPLIRSLSSSAIRLLQLIDETLLGRGK